MVNGMKTFMLMLGMTALLTAFGWVLDRFFGTGGVMMYGLFAVSLVMNWVSYFFSDKIALRAYNAKEVSPEDAPELHETIERLARRAGIPKPRVHIIPTDTPNAFATGRNPANAAVAATVGLLQLLDRDEIEGVMAHELGHVVNRDTLVQTIAATLAGAIGMAAHSAQWGMMTGGHDDREEGSGPVGAILMLVMMILAPLVATLVQMAISRTREFGADHAAGSLTGNPRALASALQKLEAMAAGGTLPRAATPGTAHMFIVNPLTGAGLRRMFSTHPPTRERVAKLLELDQTLKSRPATA
jgi:heat shock protein HtpX